MSVDVTTPSTSDDQPATAAANAAPAAATGTATVGSPDEYAPRFWGLLASAVLSIAPPIVNALTRSSTRGAPAGTQEEAESRFFSQIVDCIPILIDKVIPTLVEGIQGLQQQRGGAIGTLDDPEARGWLTEILGKVATTVALELPNAVQGFTRSPEPPPLYSEEMTDRFLPALLSTFGSAVSKTLPDLIAIITGQRVGPSVQRSGPHWEL
jgi:hypothetical protein